ncbi:hypothetical protein GOBAR_AA05430 [Gossypium barbadense]|uniref:Uncharacterized protein n=1 Tax=Gossypium barbadense TaxID=3634 RepID=A0A2P5YHS9_GOSBA|nr:hypothetical protein GOBAR_AA05430 [Gossypium barbadense]
MAATRSNNFPRSSRQHPLATEVNEHLNRLRASKEASTSSSSISHKLMAFKISEIVSEVRKYMSSKKVAKKTIHKALGNLKVIQRKNTVSPSETVSMLKEIEALTCSMFEDLLSLISKPKPRSWLSVLKLLHQSRIAYEDAGRNVNEIEKVDVALKSFGITKYEIINLEMQNQLKDLELVIQDLEDGLECLFRCMIKARVSLFNILTL